ncbi:MAG: PKD domain-containing protein [Candidatus Lernaella stagnicola]|nr:PKD domain-containing protein [Candidatus Lernaella stagnicola]
MARRVYLIVALCLVVPAVAWAAGAAPDQIRLSWEGEADTSLVLSWRTDWSIVDSVCNYGETSGYGSQAVGDTYTFTNATGLHHKVTIDGLAPRTVYHVSCGDGGGNMFSDVAFITAPAAVDQCAPIRFVVLGDSRSQTDDGASILWSTVMDGATDEEPDFVLHLGDMIAEGDHVDDGWDDFFDKSHDIGNQPFLTVWGNHDHRGGSPYLDLFHMPHNDVTDTSDWWQLRYGALHVFGLSTENGLTAYQQQATWLDEKLAATDAIWKLAFFHQAAYSSGTTHGENDEPQDYFVPQFDAYHVDVAFQSHDHTYERTKPLYAGNVVGNYEDGTLYMVSGGAGAMFNPIFNIFTRYWEYGIGVWHYALLEIEFDELHLRAIDWLGITLDEVTIRKPGIGDPTAFFTRDSDPVVQLEPVVFDGNDSIDPCGEIVAFEWDFGDGETGDGAAVEHTYDEVGEVTVLLTVTDLDGITADYSETFTVEPAAVDDDTVGDDDDDDDNDDDDNDDTAGDDDTTDDDDDNDDNDDDDDNDDNDDDDDDDDDDSAARDDDETNDGGCAC